MKRAVLIIAICLLPGMASAATLVDDFDSYTLGAVNDVTAGKWVGTTNSVIVADTADAGNKVIQVNQNASQSGVYTVLSSAAAISEGQTKTLFFRYRASTNNTDQAIGLAGGSANTPTALGDGAGWDQFSPDVRVSAGNFGVHDGGWQTLVTGINIGSTQPWYNVWLVITSVSGTGDTFKVYMHQNGDAGATESNRLRYGTDGDFAFRRALASGEVLTKFYWRAQSTGADRMVWIDDIYVMNGEDLSNPAGIYSAHNPTPANGATNVALDASLSWDTGEDPANPGSPNPAITKHYITFRKGDPNLAYVPHVVQGTVTASGATGNWTPPTAGANAMAVDGTYYWRVDESVNDSSRTDPNTIIGSIWKFDAVKSIPVIATQPKDAVAAENDPAQFSLTAVLAVGTLKYTWYYSADAVADAGDTQVGTDANSLTVSSVAVANEGYYYCTVVKVTNESNPVTSNIVKLGVKRPMAHWTLDALDTNGNYEDSIGNHDADPNGTPAFVTGAGTGTANGVTIDQVNGFATADTWNPSEMTNQITVSLWAKWAGQTTPTTWQGLISKEVSYGANTMMWQFEVVNAAEASSNVMLKNGLETGNLTINPLTVGSWEHLVVSFDGTTATIYRNGVNVAGGAWSMGTKFDAPVNIGISARSLTENLMFNGDLDDIRIWNYALTQTEVVDQYHAVTGKSACVDKPTYDFDDDCIVTLSDFAMLASEWLSSGLYQLPLMN